MQGVGGGELPGIVINSATKGGIPAESHTWSPPPADGARCAPGVPPGRGRRGRWDHQASLEADGHRHLAWRRA